ncbi:patanin-like phospholipase domain-containing protein atgl-1 isoform X2 [Anthonomus grandis grandis]|uniref:patanin-like phospholipase domain-containing protein atgl-1 isoform X2 n=1 Tax=Anthonomus grandis grandis TaxID=2921223 RepID=UPI002166AC63|nr:patanin-like phospholipase domain-containing protein atgl-1 isoform X2 [Anthonomus grandis grandis]
MNLSFAGCGFLGLYHVGVACCFRKYAPHLLLNKISGASAGAIAACCLLLDLPIGQTTSDILRVATEARKRSLGPFNPSFNIHQLLLEGLEKFLPDDAHIRVSGKLHISLTRVYDGKNVLVTQFDTREELIQALLASSFIPIFSGLFPPKFKGVRYMDGGYSDNLPTLDENTITVSPFCGESDICPRDDSSQLFHINIANTSIELSKHNIYRMVRILFPPPPETLANMCKQGFDDALRFLHRNNLINCTKCLAVQSTFAVSDSFEESFVYDPQCKDCNKHRQEALVSNVPDTVLTVFQEVIETANKGVLNWIFKHRGMKLLSVLSLPYTLPADIVYASLAKLSLLKPLVVPGGTRRLVFREVTNLELHSFAGLLTEKHSLQHRPCRALVLPHGQRDETDLHGYSERVMAAAPQVSNSVYEITKVALYQISNLLNKVNKKSRQMSAKITCQLAITEYGAKADLEHDLVGNKMNLNFTMDLDKGELPLEQIPECKFQTRHVLQRKPSITVKKTDTMDDDTFDHILQVTSQHDAIMAYYYLDENNKVKVTEIFDVTDSESPVLQTPHEKHLNTNLEFDDGWNDYETENVMDQLEDRYSVYSLTDDVIEDKNIFSDPESEWIGSCKVEEPEEDEPAFFRPESDQKTLSQNATDALNSKCTVPTFSYEEIDF